MKLRTLLALASASLALVGFAVYRLGPRTDPRARPAAAAPASTSPAPAARPRPLTDADHDAARDTLAVALRSRLERALDGPEEEPPLPVPTSRLEAEASFEAVMESVETLADKGDKVSRGRRQRLYRAANDAFSALSIHLDGNNPRDLMQLEEAHVRLKQMLGEIEAGPPGSYGVTRR